ncbi:phosphoenolpyruvate carboxykinase (ATP) [Litchfieldia salsa]|uniref:HPr Serine kinase C-terminal domain-containing protein n=1 Tax=Litchfieldia salsa TaxID=930152 RepID=A0A1H0VFX8_9BACI|nr:aldolase [Litchfieldia salsa]SDP76976.1 HPr Serine kinase C-terminal domain-containing protein [Litchfieldia salsa]
MLITRPRVKYKTFGLNLLSEIQFPELQLSKDRNVIESDIRLEITDLAERWDEVAEYSDIFYITHSVIMFKIPRIAIFSIENGSIIKVSPLEDCTEDHLRLYVLGTCMGGLLLQRKTLPLHGSAVSINGKAYAIVGDSGAGKSTLASAFLKKGYKLISDDVIPVTFSEKGTPEVTPAYPQQKLWQNSLTEFGIESTNLRPIIERETKYAIAVENQFVTQTLPLAGIFELVKTENNNVIFQEINNLERLHKLFYHTYRNFILEPAGLLKWHFSFTAQLLNHVKVYQIQRPITRFTAAELTTLILENINKEE